MDVARGGRPNPLVARLFAIVRLCAAGRNGRRRARVVGCDVRIEHVEQRLRPGLCLLRSRRCARGARRARRSGAAPAPAVMVMVVHVRTLGTLPSLRSKPREVTGLGGRLKIRRHRAKRVRLGPAARLRLLAELVGHGGHHLAGFGWICVLKALQLAEELAVLRNLARIAAASGRSPPPRSTTTTRQRMLHLPGTGSRATRCPLPKYS